MDNRIHCPLSVTGFKNLQAYSPVRIHSPEDSFELRIFLTLLYNRQIVTKGTQARLEFLVIQVTSLVLVKVPERKEINFLYMINLIGTPLTNDEKREKHFQRRGRLEFQKKGGESVVP